MKKLPILALCLAFAATAADARTLYVNASRPNNNGNGLKPSTAKKTIQAAVNIAKAGDTILVQPGTYAPIRTNNKRITIKGVKGVSKTTIVQTAKIQRDVVFAQLGKPYDGLKAKGKNTALTGFLLDGRNRDIGSGGTLVGISAGTVKSCVLQRLGEKTQHAHVIAVVNASLAGCTVKGNYGRISESTAFDRCRITGNIAHIQRNGGYYGPIDGGRLCNCLVVGNEMWGDLFSAVTLVNCTIAKNTLFHEGKTLSAFSRFYNCILWNNFRQEPVWGENDELLGYTKTVQNVSSGNGYSRTYKDNRDPKFTTGWKLAKGSPCINRGTLNSKLKKLVGSVDLAGAKRIHGASIDMGCYEY
ncbi:MAG: hypothetical protein IJS32_08115 [Kiritimatiellae bacterium]|nr:hypothetical protein [Kiritimatiellia bacterium]